MNEKVSLKKVHITSLQRHHTINKVLIMYLWLTVNIHVAIQNSYKKKKNGIFSTRFSLPYELWWISQSIQTGTSTRQPLVMYDSSWYYKIHCNKNSKLWVKWLGTWAPRQIKVHRRQIAETMYSMSLYFSTKKIEQDEHREVPPKIHDLHLYKIHLTEIWSSTV